MAADRRPIFALALTSTMLGGILAWPINGHARLLEILQCPPQLKGDALQNGPAHVGTSVVQPQAKKTALLNGLLLRRRQLPHPGLGKIKQASAARRCSFQCCVKGRPQRVAGQ